VYSGQLDVIVAVPVTEAMLLIVPWKYQAEYLRVPRRIWRVRPTDGEVAGYVRRVHDFYQVTARAAPITRLITRLIIKFFFNFSC